MIYFEKTIYNFSLPSLLYLDILTYVLGKYREFHKLYEDGDFFAAGSLLLSLLDSRLAPKE